MRGSYDRTCLQVSLLMLGRSVIKRCVHEHGVVRYHRSIIIQLATGDSQGVMAKIYDVKGGHQVLRLPSTILIHTQQYIYLDYLYNKKAICFLFFTFLVALALLLGVRQKRDEKEIFGTSFSHVCKISRYFSLAELKANESIQE